MEQEAQDKINSCENSYKEIQKQLKEYRTKHGNAYIIVNQDFTTLDKEQFVETKKN